jgi:cyclohexadienyl dehydratase
MHPATRYIAAVFLALSLSGATMAERTLTVGTTGDYAPVTWFDTGSGEYVGEDIDLVRAFARASGYAVTFVRTTWSSLMSDLIAGKFQMAVGGISGTAERAKLGLVSIPIATTGKVALVRCGEEERYGSLAEIDQVGTRVIENRGGTNQPFALAEIKHAVIILVPDNDMAFEYLENDSADVMFTDSIEAVYHQQEREGLCAVKPDKPFTHVDKVFLFQKDEGALRDAFNAWFATQPK